MDSPDRPRTESDDLDDRYEEDVDDWIATELDYLGISAASIEETTGESTPEDPLDKEFSKHSQDLARFLTTLKKPAGMSRVEFRALKREATKYSVRN